jgi:alkylhydroperoxidase/carboxymuconolactone decarboxylase family protein YurZ
MPSESLPPIVEQIAREHPEIWKAYKSLGDAASAAGPIDARSQRLLKLAIAVGAGREGSVRSQVRRGGAAGLTRQEMHQVAFLAITTIGWPAAVAALSWIDGALEKAGKAT